MVQLRSYYQTLNKLVFFVVTQVFNAIYYITIREELVIFLEY